MSKAIKKGISKKGTTIHTRVQFYRPKTRKHDRKPKYQQKSTPKKNTLDKHSIIKYPLTTESSMKLIEDSNTTASFILTVVRYVSMMLSLLLFIFGPLVFQQRKRQREGGDSRLPQRTTTVTMSNDSNAETASHELQGARFRIAELEVQVENLSSRIKELETMPAACVTLRDFTILDENVWRRVWNRLRWPDCHAENSQRHCLI